MTNAQAVGLVKLLIEGHPRGGSVTREMAAVYAADLTVFEYDEAVAAVAFVRQSSEFFPTIAGIVDAILTKKMAHLPADWSAAYLVAERYASALASWRDARTRAENALSSTEYNEWVERGMPELVSPPEKPPEEVMEAAQVVGGVSALIESGNPTATRSQFRDAYEARVAKKKETLRLSYAALGAGPQRELPS